MKNLSRKGHLPKLTTKEIENKQILTKFYLKIKKPKALAYSQKNPNKSLKLVNSNAI